MAVFPDKIILKNSTDLQAVIETAIGSGGSDEITYGELVVGREDGFAKLYTLDSNGDVVVAGGTGAIGEVSTYTPELGTYATRINKDSQTSTGEWSVSGTTGFVFPLVASNGYNLGNLGANPASLGISEDGIVFTYYTCTNWVANVGGAIDFFTATLTGINTSDFWDLGNRKIWVDFSAKVSPTEGSAIVFETEIDAFKIKKNSIVNQDDFDYQREASVYEFDFSTTDTNYPSSGNATKWSTPGDSKIYLSTTDKNAVSAQTDLYRLIKGSSVVFSVNGSVVYNDALTSATDKDTSRIQLEFPSVQSWITNLQSGDVVGIKSDEVFDLQATALAVSDGQVMTWVDADSEWKPVDPASTVNAIDDLSDVTITAAADGEVLRHNGTAWVDAQLAYSDLSGTPSIPSSIDDLTDVTITAAADGEVLRHNGTAWVDATLDYGDLSVTASQLRTTLGIGEYADDTAAGSGGVASGALYYNTTNSNYVLKS